MATHRQIKKKSRSFTLTDDEFEDLIKRAGHLGFTRHGKPDRNAFFAALLEADRALKLEITLENRERVLRPTMGIAMAAEDAGSYEKKLNLANVETAQLRAELKKRNQSNPSGAT